MLNTFGSMHSSAGLGQRIIWFSLFVQDAAVLSEEDVPMVASSLYMVRFGD